MRLNLQGMALITHAIFFKNLFNFLEEVLPNGREDIPLKARRSMWF